MAIKPTDEAQTAQALSKQAKKPLDFEADGVKVSFAEGAYRIQFPFSQTKTKALRSTLEGVGWDKEAKAFAAPVTQYDAVKQSVEKLRELSRAMASNYDQIDEAARLSFSAGKTSVSKAFTKDGLRTTGVILAENVHFVAQAHKVKDGVQYIAIHERAAIAQTKDVPFEQLKVGKELSIFYKNGAALMWNPSATAENAARPAEEAAAPAKPQAPAAKARAPKRAASQASAG